MPSIKAIILDIDGVIVGEKIGYNSPDPHPNVIEVMKSIQDSGIPIILCTAKPGFAINSIITAAHLDNLHITDGGGVVIDPLGNTILSEHSIPHEIVEKIVSSLLTAGIYTELYTTKEYIIQRSQRGEITRKHEHVIQSPPREVDSLIDESHQVRVTKIMPIARDPNDKGKVVDLLAQFIPSVTLSWGVHPVILPLQFGIVTAPGISKAIASSQILNHLQISPEHVLGVGDSTSDWQFMEPCGYVAAMGNASEELKSLVKSRSNDHSFIAPSVDENGILVVFDHFKLNR